MSIPMVGQMSIPGGDPMGAGIVDFLASDANQRVWYILRHEKDYAATLTSGTVDHFDVATSAAIDGNVERPGTLPEPQLFFVHGISMRLEARATEADAKLIADSLYMEIQINNRRELGPLNFTHFPAGGGLYGSVATADTTTPVAELILVSNGIPSPKEMYWLPVPIVEKGGEVFRYVVTIGVTLAALAATRRVEVAQHGQLWRRSVTQ